MSLEEKTRRLHDNIQEIIDHRIAEIGYYDEDDTIILMLEDLQDELKIFMEQT